MLIGSGSTTHTNIFQYKKDSDLIIGESQNAKTQLSSFQLDVTKFSLNEELPKDFTEIKYNNNSITLVTPELIEEYNQKINPWVGVSHKDFKQLVEDPLSVMESERSNYEQFLSGAEAMIAELELMDKTDKIDLSVDTYGFISVKVQDYSTDETMRNLAEIKEWIKGNSEIIEENSQLGRRFALANSIIDYEASTGINNKNLHTLEPRITNGTTAEIVGQATKDASRGIEYLCKMRRYASFKFGVPPMSYNKIDDMGHPANAAYSDAQSVKLLPDMN